MNDLSSHFSVDVTTDQDWHSPESRQKKRSRRPRPPDHLCPQILYTVTVRVVQAKTASGNITTEWSLAAHGLLNQHYNYLKVLAHGVCALY